jgi:uncharacterized protein YcfJ
MNARTIVVAAALTLVSSAALASHHRAPAHAYGRVVDVQPIVRHVTVERPRERCWEDTAYEPANPLKVAGTTIAGGVIGGAIGHQLGSGRERDVLTAIGAVAGAAVANQRALGRNGYVAVPVQRCEVVSDRFTERHIDGYLVTYRHHGRLYTMRTRTPPGDRVRLGGDVIPVRY